MALLIFKWNPDVIFFIGNYFDTLINLSSFFKYGSATIGGVMYRELIDNW